MSFKNFLKGIFTSKPPAKKTPVKKPTQAYKGLPADFYNRSHTRSEYDANRNMEENVKIEAKDKPSVRKYLGARRGRTNTGSQAHPIEIYKEESMSNDMASINAEIARRREAQRTVVSRFLRLARRTSDD